MKRAKYNLLALLIMAIFAGTLILGNVSYTKLSVAAVPGSYAEQFAKENDLDLVSVPDNMKGGLDLHYETFEYNSTGSGTIMEKYDGVGKEVVVPQVYGKKTVTGLSEDFFAVSAVEKLYLPSTVEIFPSEVAWLVTLVVPDNSAVRADLLEKGWRVETYATSEAPNFSLSEIPFGYNDKGDSIELTMYTGNEKELVIPSYINGKPVKSVSFDMVGKFSTVLFPETVTSITGEVRRLVYSLVFAIELGFTLLAFVVTMLVLNLKLPKLTKANEYHLTGPQVILSFVYLIAQCVFAVLAIYKYDLSAFVCLAVSAAMFLLYLLAISMAGTGREHAIDTEERELEKTEWMDAMRAETANLADGVKDRTARKSVERVVEELRYSDPSSHPELRECEDKIEDMIDALKEAVEQGNTEVINELSASLMSLLRERNAQLKSLK